jgi:spermidine synthase
MFNLGERILLPAGQMDSFNYLSLSALALAVSIFPWCVCMGTTFPFMMAYVREREQTNRESFSFLYLANVLGAMSGTFCTALILVEALGFQHTLWVAAAGNFTIAWISVGLALEQQQRPAAPPAAAGVQAETPAAVGGPQSRLIKMILFSTGFCAMAMEVVWSRAFTPALNTEVYSFAMIVFAYLGATFVGSLLYRRDLRLHSVKSKASLMSLLAVAVFLPVVVNDPRLVTDLFWTPSVNPRSAMILLGSIFPFCALLGYLTPGLIDDYAAGQPRHAGPAYAINVLGCILGPLVGSYVLLPLVSERYALILLAAPFVVFALVLGRRLSRVQRLAFGLAASAALVWSLLFCEDFETYLVRRAKLTVIRRDYMASVISVASDARMNRNLLVNGIGMTVLTPITKFIAHLPLAFHRGQPQSALVICFGMGTTYRSALSWGIDTTTIELVPSVTQAFGFYHADAGRCVNDPKGHIIIDDGRRYLKRTDKRFDVIVVDPPPPVEAAGSSLLFSTEFYALAKRHLNTNGIVEMWFPGSGPDVGRAVIRSICESFPYVRGFPSVEGWGVHLLGSMTPFERLSPAQLAARLPPGAAKDLMEWADSPDAASYMARVIDKEFPLPLILSSGPAGDITDDRPLNEYYLLRFLSKSVK